MQYEILLPVAWDFIAWEERFEKAVSAAEALVFGSLSMRNEVSCSTLFQLLDVASYRVFDVNLRQPFYTVDLILKALKKTDLLKLNQHELEIISHWIDPDVEDETRKIRLLQDNFQIGEILVTRGSRGASYYRPGVRFDIAACHVKVADTVGSGDAFLAAFLAQKLKKENTIEMQLSMASTLGAFVAEKEGACPEYSKEDLEQFKNVNFYKPIIQKSLL